MKRQLFVLALLSLVAMPLWAADNCSTTIEGNDAMQYNKDEITVPSNCDKFTVTLKHTGDLPRDTMGHNWTLSDKGDKDEIVSSGSDAGLDNGYIDEDDDNIIAHTALIGGGESDSVTFKTSKLKSGGSYVYFCTFPGHAAMMHGKLKVK